MGLEIGPAGKTGKYVLHFLAHAFNDFGMIFYKKIVPKGGWEMNT